MKKPFFFCTILIAILFTGCFEIREEVNLKSDGSGELTIVANLSQSKGKVRQYLKMGVAEGHHVPSPYEVEHMLGKIKSILEETEGITLAQTKEDWSNYIFTVTARFDKINAVNKGLRELSEQLGEYGMPDIKVDNFSFANGQFKRHFNYPAPAGEFEKLPPVQQKMFAAAKMISIYRFEQDIKTYSHPGAQLSPSGRAIMLQIPLADLATGKATLANTIGF